MPGVSGAATGGEAGAGPGADGRAPAGDRGISGEGERMSGLIDEMREVIGLQWRLAKDIEIRSLPAPSRSPGARRQLDEAIAIAARLESIRDRLAALAAADQLGPAILEAIAELRALADDAAPSRRADRIDAVADRLVRAAGVLAADAGEPGE